MDVVELICDMEKQKRDFGQEMTPEELENISKIATARLKQIMDLDVRRN